MSDAHTPSDHIPDDHLSTSDLLTVDEFPTPSHFRLLPQPPLPLYTMAADALRVLSIASISPAETAAASLIFAAITSRLCPDAAID